ncbi:MAG: alpha/beta fold hydrolase, partial [bacterium]|nr:alpha/beta fold hydrolase [bacterium]
MNNNDFRYMRRGKQLADLAVSEIPLLQAINQRGSGKKRALLALHGFSSSPAVYRYLLPHLKNYDAIICPALPGHGESIAAFSQASAAEWLAAVSSICETLITEYQQVDVLGLSLGGLLACKLSERFTLNHLYLLAPALKLKLNVNRMCQLAQCLHWLGFQQLRNAAGNLISNEHAEIAYKKLPINTIIEMLKLAKNNQWIAPQCPVDLFLGFHDLIVSSAEVEKLFLPLPHATIHWL